MANIQERLDRSLARSDWRIAFNKAEVVHLNAINSDHVPIMLCSTLDHEFNPRPFRLLEA